MTQYDFSILLDCYPETIRQMPAVFGSHQFILELARQNQAEYVQALYAYRDSLHDGKPAPFKAVHQILSTKLNDFPTLITRVRPNRPSTDIFGQSNTCAEWRKV